MAKNGFKIFDTDTHVPHTVEMVMNWQMTDARKRKLFWENPLRYYPRCGLK